MKETIEGIILNETNYGETSKILNILTLEHGYISVMSKGSRTMKSKLRGISLKLIYAKFTITYKEKGISNLIEGSLIDSFKNIMTDFNKMTYANKIINLIKSVLKENNDKSIYIILRDSLLKINDNFDGKLINYIVATKLLTYLGVKPNFNECFNCGSQDIITFDLKIPAAICKNCYHDEYLFQTNTLKLLRLFQELDISKLTKLKISSKEVINEIENFLQDYYDSYTGIYLKI